MLHALGARPHTPTDPGAWSHPALAMHRHVCWQTAWHIFSTHRHIVTRTGAQAHQLMPLDRRRHDARMLGTLAHSALLRF